MAQSFNKVILIGRLTKDPETRVVNNEKKVATFTLAVNGYGDKTNFFDCEAWGKTGEYIATYQKKGGLLVTDGELVQQVWEKDGQKHSRVVIRVSNAQSLSIAPKQKENSPMPQTVAASPDIDIDSIPFN